MKQNTYLKIVENNGNYNNAPYRMSSLEIAKLTEKQHKHVLRDIRNTLKELDLDVNPFLSCHKIPGPNGGLRDSPVYMLPRRECLILVSGYSIKLRAAIIDRWEELEIQNIVQERDDLLIIAKTLRIAEKSITTRDELLNAQAPAVQFANAIETKANDILIGNFAKIIGMGPNQFFTALRKDKILMDNKKSNHFTNIPYQPYINRGYFTVSENVFFNKYTGKEEVSTVTYITGKGQKWLAQRYPEV